MLGGGEHGVYDTLPIGKRKGNPDIIYLQRIRLFHLDENAPITFHSLTGTGKVTAINNFSTSKNKIVIINPYSSTMHHVTIALYETLCDVLILRGYHVYTNVVDGQSPLKGSQSLRCSIEELFTIACNIPLIVSVRSGILDFLVSSNINMFVIYENVTKSKCYDRYRLASWHCQGIIEEIYISDKKILKDVPDRFSMFLDSIGM